MSSDKTNERQKRNYRSRDQLPDPQKNAYTEYNRTKKLFKIRLQPEFAMQVDAVAKSLGLSRQEYVENLLKNSVKRHLDNPKI
jgi:hypothetical protein